MIKKLLIIVVFFLGAITFAQSETSWIKKKDKSEKVEKIKKVENKKSSWINKKKENKENLKKQKKENKSWITKKSKKEIKEEKKKLDIYLDLKKLPNAEFYFVNSQSTIYKYKTNNESKHNYRIGYGFDITSISGWSVVTNFERFGASGKGYSNEFYLSLGYVPIDEIKFAFQLNDFKNASIDFTKKVNDLDLKITTNYDFLSVVPNYNANISISNSF